MVAWCGNGGRWCDCFQTRPARTAIQLCTALTLKCSIPTACQRNSNCANTLVGLHNHPWSDRPSDWRAQVSEVTWRLLSGPQRASFQERGNIQVKGKGVMHTYLCNPYTVLGIPPPAELPTPAASPPPPGSAAAASATSPAAGSPAPAPAPGPAAAGTAVSAAPAATAATAATSAPAGPTDAAEGAAEGAAGGAS